MGDHDNIDRRDGTSVTLDTHTNETDETVETDETDETTAHDVMRQEQALALLEVPASHYLRVGEPAPGPVLHSRLLAVYAGLPDDVVKRCEESRRRILRNVYRIAIDLRAVHDDLAPQGKFKEWCQAAGLNYSTAKNALR